MRMLWAIWFAVRSLPDTLARIEWKLGKIMGVLEDVDAQVAAVNEAVAEIEATVQEVDEAANRIEQRVSGMGLSPEQEQALADDVEAMRQATSRLGAVKTNLADVTTGLNAAGTTPGTGAATVTQPASPDVAGEGVLHEDGSVAPDQSAAPQVGTTEVVQ